MKRHRFITKIEGLFRLFMINCLSEYLPLYIVTEYPKAGGSWVSQMLSDYLCVPFPKNEFPNLKSSVMHGHYLYSHAMKNTFVILRDGRDIMVSYYFHSFFYNNQYNDRLVDISRKLLRFEDYNNVEKNLPRFIEFKFSHTKYPRFTWSDFVNSWIDKDVAFIKYEHLLQDPAGEMAQALEKVCNMKPDLKRLTDISRKYSFKALSKRNQGEEDRSSFLRKGIAGDWKNYFNKEAITVFKKFAGEELIKLGYETDNSWM